MTPEQLLLRRFKCIALYPESQYKLGEIITIAVEQTEDGIMQKVQRDPEGIGDTGLWYDSTKFWDFDKNFQELNWWEERKPEDLPKYVKTMDGNPVVYRVRRYDGLLFIYATLTKPEDSEWLYKVIPASKEEEAKAWNNNIPWNKEVE